MIKRPQSEEMKAKQNKIVTNAVRALLYEVSVQPKPGLVDPVSSGPHPDMDVFTFLDSSVSLTAYFKACVQTAWSFNDEATLPTLFEQIRPLGIQAEATMFDATSGINTHKGAVFSLGIVVTATAYAESHDRQDVFKIVKEMLVGLVERDFSKVTEKAENEMTAGEREYVHFGITGIRGEAEHGYLTVTQVALPQLSTARGTLNERLLDTLMAIVGHSVDTNLVKRAGSIDIIPWANDQVSRYFLAGGSRTEAGMAYLKQLNQVFLEKNLSLGGSADLLIVTIFVALSQGII
ncbi:triphosphoribosyl-dephospho-CoA synthase [Secundilactobacillus kimchicus JCM 15530]|uniref:Probable 2-(5''-triphosphoribosyl)-3'-dephosphocoenzyme-A synthase n=1 Tax=Secundilactobacillus kimchicus JCM 15530 TaxID=1302272 RepID=A0A0R1HR18_9LACO|nr:triphosphoribosyl-dephospho-CoA synthase CitG [Secundilactobacillus kimchicus]KRK48747.1 triphosphoribosyl-dephospho-CoA synthase [Secundilactobacillus kimchicus JCM 15530]